MSEAIDDMEAFTKLTDGIFHSIGVYPAQSEKIKEVVFYYVAIMCKLENVFLC